MRKIIIIVLSTLFGAIFSLSAQSKKEKKELKKQMVKELIASENYKINVNRALPMSGRSISLTSPYSLEVKNDSIFSYLPYFGKAYSIPYGGGEGLIFKALIEKYAMNIDKKGNVKIKISTRTMEDKHDFSISIFDNGAASINVTMQNRQSISFNGELETELSKKK